MSISPKMSMAETIGRLCAGAWLVVRRVTDNLFNRVKTGARAAARQLLIGHLTAGASKPICESQARAAAPA